MCANCAIAGGVVQHYVFSWCCSSNDRIANFSGATIWSRGVTVSTLDPESSDRGSNPREAFTIYPTAHVISRSLARQIGMGTGNRGGRHATSAKLLHGIGKPYPDGL